MDRKNALDELLAVLSPVRGDRTIALGETRGIPAPRVPLRYAQNDRGDDECLEWESRRFGATSSHRARTIKARATFFHATPGVAQGYGPVASTGA